MEAEPRRGTLSQSGRSDSFIGGSHGPIKSWSRADLLGQRKAVDLVTQPTKCVAGMAGSEYVAERSKFLLKAPCETLLIDRDSGLFGAHWSAWRVSDRWYGRRVCLFR